MHDLHNWIWSKQIGAVDMRSAVDFRIFPGWIQVVVEQIWS